ncbi:hypothetical protein NDI44_20720 [Trichocoleus sp. DQ-A3]|nr:hypothetical protein [Coleofasciculus sp. FACHB-125]MBD1903510.1 hypothetical protein [Coleofasciculus sp. FACHB-125]
MSILILHGQTSALWREGDRSSASNGLLPIFILITTKLTGRRLPLLHLTI